METILTVLNVVLAIVLVLIILLQRSEGGALGLGLSQENFASTRTVGNFLTKSTAIIATLFIISSISLVILSRGDLQETQSVLEKIEEEKDSNTPKIDFERTLLNLSDKIQYRIATLSFRSGSSIVDRKALRKIKKVAEVAKTRNAKVKIVGHASTRTRDMPNSKHKLVNFVISDKRAQSVAKAFINYNFPKENLITEAVSDSKPLFKENMPAGTQANQRTEIFLIY